MFYLMSSVMGGTITDQYKDMGKPSKYLRTAIYTQTNPTDQYKDVGKYP
jgi:hypothetical protein